MIKQYCLAEPSGAVGMGDGDEPSGAVGLGDADEPSGAVGLGDADFSNII